MTEPTKIDFRHRRIRSLQDVTDLVELLFPGNRNQGHAAARILTELKAAGELVPTMKFIEDKYSISRRTLQRTRAKLARLGLIERISRFNTRYGGQEGWRLSTRMSGSLRALAAFIDRWEADVDPKRVEKDQTLVELLR